MGGAKLLKLALPSGGAKFLKCGGPLKSTIPRGSMANVDDCWRVGLLQPINAHGAPVACLKPRALVNGHKF